MVRKRVFDVVVGSALALLALPVIGVLAVVLGVTFRAWPFFVQDRLGLGGQHFRMVKLRTLRPETGPYVLKDELPTGAASGLSCLLRRWHLDELPQLLLVPLGRLSLVGPRPKMPDGYEPVDPAYGARRVQVPQGCTGLWQIGRHSAGLPSAAPQYDLFYVANTSLRLDVWILWRTALLMLGVGAAVDMVDIPRWAVGPLGKTANDQVADAEALRGEAA